MNFLEEIERSFAWFFLGVFLGLIYIVHIRVKSYLKKKRELKNEK